MSANSVFWTLICLIIKAYCSTSYTHTTILRPFFRDYLGKPVPGEIFCTLLCKGR